MALVNRVVLARKLGVAPSSIARMELDGMPSRKAGRGRETLFSVRRCQAWRDAQGSAVSSEVAAARSRKELAQALEAEQRIAIKAKEYVRAADVEQELAQAFMQCRTKLLGLARKAKTILPHLTAADVLAIDGLVRQALEDLANTP